jgi:hypothetical protein
VERLLQSLFIRPSEAADVDSFHLADAGQGSCCWFRWMHVAVGVGVAKRARWSSQFAVMPNLSRSSDRVLRMPPCHYASFGMTKWLPVASMWLRGH